MPSTLVFPQSGGITLVSGNVFSGGPFPAGSIQLHLAKAAPGAIYVGLPLPGVMSGLFGNASGAVTNSSGGSQSSGGMTDGMELNPGDNYQIDKVRMTSGIESVTLVVPAASSGGRLFWDFF